jgi:hypothetical protein
MPDRDPNAIDWPRVYAEAVRLALSFTKRDAQDVVQEAMKLYLAGEAPWVPGGRVPLPEHLVVVGLDARSKQRRTERRRWKPAVVSKIAGMFNRSAPTPEQNLAAAEDDQHRARLFEKLVRELERQDPQAHRIVLLEQEGVHDAAEQAAQSGMSMEDVHNARKRIKRRVLALGKEEEES